MTKQQKKYLEEKKCYLGKIEELKAIVTSMPSKEYNLSGKNVMADFGIFYADVRKVSKLAFADSPTMLSVFDEKGLMRFDITTCTNKEIKAIYNAVMDDLESEFIINTKRGDFYIKTDEYGLLYAVSVHDECGYFLFGKNTSEEEMISGIEHEYEESYELGDVSED